MSANPNIGGVEYRERLSYEYLLLNALMNTYNRYVVTPEAPYASQLALRKKAFVDSVRGLLNLLTPDLYSQVRQALGKDPLKYLDYAVVEEYNPNIEDVPTIIHIFMFPRDLVDSGATDVGRVARYYFKGEQIPVPEEYDPQEYVWGVASKATNMVVRRAEEILRAIIKVFDENDLLLTSKYAIIGTPVQFMQALRGGGGGNAQP